MTLTWTGVTAGTTPGGDILGYVLKVKDCMNGTEWTAFDGVDIATPTQRRTTVTGLIPGREYKATVTAYNLNGAGQTSAEFSFYSCGLPSLMSAPTRITSDLLTMTVGWSAPLVTGGCQIIGYAVYMDDGTGTSTFAEVNAINDAAVRNRPGLSQLQITTFSSGDEGTSY